MNAPLTVEEIDPRTLLVNLNIRDAQPDKDLIASIKDQGVLQPVIAYRTADGEIRVRYGNRRTLAAISASTCVSLSSLMAWAASKRSPST